MKQPDATYRVQLSPQFTFNDLEEIIDYLGDLGISTIYAAPFFQARQGSTHGYDVLNPKMINNEIGDLEQFKKIRERLQQKGMTWLQDIVPNHMAYEPDNPWIKDILELGPHSAYYNFFDIDWDYKGWQQVIAPFLGDTLDEILKNEELQFKLDENGISINYYENSYPLSAKSYALFLNAAGETEMASEFHQIKNGADQWKTLKSQFLDKVNNDDVFQKSLNKVIDRWNKSVKDIIQVLEEQYFKPAYWKITEREINYRRFFTINGLICLRMEDPKVFNSFHSFIKELCEQQFINGVRIDHVDGMFDPAGYARQLREMLGDDFYIIVEKILEADEKLPKDWPVQGTSGYDFLAQINQLFTRSASELTFNKEYEKISPKVADYEKLVFNKKIFILKERMGGELQNLWEILKTDLLPKEEQKNEENWKEVLGYFLAAFPVYRIYPEDYPLNSHQKEQLEIAYDKAKEYLPEKEKELTFLKSVFFGKEGKDQDKMLYFLQRCQQFCGPLTAKGVEDTSFYIYNRFIAHNEVGDSPENFGITIQDFHSKMLERKSEIPTSINATATHDTKRGEDSRMRLSVLSELPEDWFNKVAEWKEINGKIRKDKQVPGNNEEYFIYQTLIAGLPFDQENDFLQRTCDYLQKVLREAKVHSNWAQPDEEYEQAVFDFIKDILDHKDFRESFNPYCDEIAGYGVLKSLGQSVLKTTTPGIPDTYQGTELWDLSFVDPDNRRPVDYETRKKYLSEFKSLNDSNLKNKIIDLKSTYATGEIKMFAVHQTLSDRKTNQKVYREGDYIPLTVKGKHEGVIICYARKYNDDWRIIAAPVLVNKLFDPENLSLKATDLEDTKIILPGDAPKNWFNIFTGTNVTANEGISLKELFNEFPVGLLKNNK